jgi:serine/threonine-protein kinase
LFERARDDARAGEAFAAGGQAARAAHAFERAGRPADGARALEKALRDDDGNDGLRLELAELLSRHGRLEACVKVIQAMRSGSPERARALPLLARSLRSLGLAEAGREVEEEMLREGSVIVPPPPATAEAPVDPSAQAASPTAAPVLFGRFEVVREVAKTPHAHVHEAIDRLGGRRVAVKMLVASFQGGGRDAFMRFEREAQALRRMSHSSIVPLVGYFPDGPAMVLEWMQGGSLADMMRQGPFAPARAAEVAVSVLSALGEAHRLGILHRDVKPSNVLFDAIGTPRLSDFGAAHLGDLSTTATAGAIGTFAYMSPEQRRGQPATVTSDLYAVGALLYEMITGLPAEPQRRSPGSPGAFPQFIERAPSAFHDDLLTAHDDVLARLLSDAPDDRPSDAFEARRLIQGLPWSSRVLPREAPASKARSSRPPTDAGRLLPARDFGDGRDAPTSFFDAITERHVLVLRLDDDTLALARGFARAADTPLPLVLRASVEESVIWVARPAGRALADGEDLSAQQLARLERAVATLHEVGASHGCIDAEHVYVHEGEVGLAFPRQPPGEAPRAADLQAIEALRVRS